MAFWLAHQTKKLQIKGILSSMKITQIEILQQITGFFQQITGFRQQKGDMKWIGTHSSRRCDLTRLQADGNP